MKLNKLLKFYSRSIIILLIRFLDSLRRIKYRNELPKKLSLQKNVTVRPTVDFSFTTIFDFYDFDQGGLIHIGAHNGSEVPDYIERRLFPIYLIEPLPEPFQELNIYRTQNNIKIDNFALGAGNQILEMFVADNDGQSSSILEPSIHLQEAPDINFVSKISVQVKRLDSLIEIKHSYKFWILDVQGYELEVLHGAGECLRYVDYIYIEVNRKKTYKDCVLVNELDDFLNYYGLKRVLTRWFNSWGDALYIKSELTKRQ